ncbi:MAG: DUF393 domain-containing protein [Acidobacteria bacterium]|nr:DUF393 domain-containing protein [Acidobacteriota bacterium]
MEPSSHTSSSLAFPVLLYDGVCGFCNHSVQFILRFDRQGTLRFAPLQSEFAQSLLNRHPHIKNIDSVIYVAPGSNGQSEQVFVRSTAALKIAAYLGGWWNIFWIGNLVPGRLRDLAYDVFAKHRYRWFGKHDSCLLPSAEMRSRFIGFS